MSQTGPLPEIVKDLPPTARLIYRELQHAGGGPLTITDLVHRTGCPPSSIRRARNELDDHSLIVEQWSCSPPERQLALNG